MSRHSRIVGSLQEMVRVGAILEHHKTSNPADPTRLQWWIQKNPLTLHYYSTNEVEAFISGAESMQTSQLSARL